MMYNPFLVLADLDYYRRSTKSLGTEHGIQRSGLWGRRQELCEPWNNHMLVFKDRQEVELLELNE